MTGVFITEFKALSFRRSEILRYMGCPSEDEQTRALVDECLELCDGVFTPRVCYAEFDIFREMGEMDIGFAKVKSTALSKVLEGCDKIIVFCATVGHGIDRLIARNSRLSPSKAVCLQAIGAEAIESLCNLFCEEMKKNGRELKPRFSAGYGDLPIELQRDIFLALSCESKIGVTLNESLLMSPTKSVSAIIGIKN